MDYKALIKSLTKKQRKVFDQICIGNDAGHSKLTLFSLVKKGLIQEYYEKPDGILTIFRYNFTNYGVHMAWCEVCTEENPEELEVLAL
jgi:hypothetical protein